MTGNDSTTRLNDGEDLEIAEPEDFGIQRGPEGDLKPVKQRIPGTDRAIRCKPVVDSEPVESVLEAADPSPKAIDDVAQEHIVEGIGANGDLSDLPDYLIQGVLQAIKNASGNDVFLAVQEQRAQENLGMLQTLGEDDIEKLRGLMDEEIDEMPQQ